MSMLDFFIGVVSGICSAMGVGGGSILLLYLTAFAGYDQLSAQGINLVFFLPAALCALISHFKNGYVKWKSAAVAVILGIPGAFLGSYIAGNADKGALRTLFALFLLFIGIRELFAKKQ